MADLVRIAARAERDLAYLYEEVTVLDSAADSATARRWYEGLKRAIVSLAVHPKRCRTTAENRNLRHLLYGRKPNVYRVIYRVNERRKQVDVLHIRHGARRGFRATEIGYEKAMRRALGRKPFLDSDDRYLEREEAHHRAQLR